MIVVLIFHQLLTREQIWPIFQYELAMNKRACLKRKDELNFGVAFCCCWFFFFFLILKKMMDLLSFGDCHGAFVAIHRIVSPGRY